MLGKRRRQPMVAPPKKKRKFFALEEIKFDPDAREDYLTGFHKRKLQRIKHAQEEAAKREREDRIKARKILREKRKRDIEKHVEEVNALVRSKAGNNSSVDEAEATDGEWNGIQEQPAQNQEAEYTDDDRFTTVTVEAVDVSRDGFQRSSEAQEHDDVSPEDSGGISQHQTTGSETLAHGGTLNKRPRERPKKKKKKFRYESKAERKLSRYKEKSKNRKQARDRKS